MTPTLKVTPGQRPLRACRSRTIRLASRMALRPFSGSTPACAARPLTVIRVSMIPLRADTMSPFARAHSRTKQASACSAAARMCGVDEVDPISSSGLAMNVRRSNGTPPSSPTRALSAYRPASRPDFMSVTPGPYATPSSMRNGRGGRRPGVEDGVHVPDRAGPAAPRRDPRTCRRPCPVAAFRIRPMLHGGAETLEEPARPRADLVDARRRVAAAVDVDEVLEVGQEVRQVGRDDRAQGVEFGVTGDRRHGVRPWRPRFPGGQSMPLPPCYPARTVRLVETRLLEGPNVYRLEPVVKLEVAVGKRRTWYGQRDPGRHALVRLGAAIPARLWPNDVAGVVAWVRRLRIAHGEGRSGLAVHRSSDPGPLDHHVPVDRPRTVAHADGGRPRARGEATSRRARQRT